MLRKGLAVHPFKESLAGQTDKRHKSHSHTAVRRLANWSTATTWPWHLRPWHRTATQDPHSTYSPVVLTVTHLLLSKTNHTHKNVNAQPGRHQSHTAPCQETTACGGWTAQRHHAKAPTYKAIDSQSHFNQDFGLVMPISMHSIYSLASSEPTTNQQSQVHTLHWKPTADVTMTTLTAHVWCLTAATLSFPMQTLACLIRLSHSAPYGTTLNWQGCIQLYCK